MMNVTEKNRITTYRNADEIIRTLYVDDSISDMLIKKYPHCDNRETYQVIGDTILGFHKTSELPILLQEEIGISADDAQKIITDLSEFLAPVYEREKNEVPFKQQELSELQQSLEDSQPEALPAENKEGVSQLESSAIQPMRTMEADMNRVHGYGAYRDAFPDEVQEAEHTEEVIRSASQEDLLAKKPALTDMPSYEEGEKK